MELDNNTLIVEELVVGKYSSDSFVSTSGARSYVVEANSRG
jgi:hypothetical protein